MTPSDSKAQPAPTIDQELGRLRDLTRNQKFAEALAVAEKLEATAAADSGGNRDILYLIATNQRCLHRFDAALATLARLEQHHPRYSRLFQERGFCCVALRDAHRAIDAFQRAVSLNPALPQSWSLLERLYAMAGDSQNAATAAAHVSTLTRQPAEIVQANGLLCDGDLAAAENILRPYLLRSGTNVEALRTLARIEHQRHRLDEAERLLKAVLQHTPDYHAARADYVRVLIDRQLYSNAREELDALLRNDPNSPDYLALHATTCTGLGEHEKAAASYRQLLATTPGSPELLLSLGHSLQTTGETTAAIESYRAAVTARPSFGDAWWSLANLKTHRFAQEEIARMRAEEAAPGAQPVDRYHLCFALGKALEDLGEFEQSWQYYERGNRLKRETSHCRPQISETNTRLQMDVCTPQFFAARTGFGVPDRDPIFIVGLPRSGSTLVEQILASHPLVEGTHELPDIQRIALDDPGYPAVLVERGSEHFQRLGQRYLADTRVYRRGGEPRFIDKMPNNFRHIGLIHLMLPNATVIDVRREPLACCFSNLKQLFASGQDFTYGIEDIARYYRTYLDLMRHWDEVLPGRVLRVYYDDVVNDLEGNVRRILDFCDLPFEPACARFYNTRRSVTTPSSEQVRQPIFRAGLDQWRHYEPWLGPLKDALGDALNRYRD